MGLFAELQEFSERFYVLAVYHENGKLKTLAEMVMMVMLIVSQRSFTSTSTIFK